MGIIETIKSFLAMRPDNKEKEDIMAEEKLTAEQADQLLTSCTP
jgi:hypothetical protein